MPYATLTLDVSSADAELASDALFACGATALEERGTRRKTRLLVHAARRDELESMASELPEALAARGIDASRYRISIAVQADDWEKRVLDELRATEIAPGYWLRPTHDAAELPADAKVLCYRPALAFGDGGHPTTRLASRALVEICQRWHSAMAGTRLHGSRLAL
jgi:ribosomal protein L11 methylase PrmA